MTLLDRPPRAHVSTARATSARARVERGSGLRRAPIGFAYAAVALLVVAVAWLIAQPHGALLAAVVAVLVIGVAALVVAGPEGLGMAFLGLCFLNAPFFRLFQLSSSSAISAIDPMLMIATILLLPRIARGRPQVSLMYMGSAIAFIVIGYAAALASSAAGATMFEITQWVFLAVVLPLVFIALELTDREIAWFAILYIAGQMLSSLDAIAVGADPVNHRYQGLAGHPNYFADGAMMAACLLLYLHHHPQAKSALNRWLWWVAMMTCLFGIYVSGARGPALGLAAVFVLVPLVERSTVSAFFATLSVALVAVLIQPLTQDAGQGNTLARLTGQDGTGTRTSNFRLSEWSDAISRIQHSPLLGSGLSLDVLSFHNNYLEIGAGIGVFGLAAYLFMLWSLTRGLFGPSAERRLLYPMVAFAVYGLTQPGFKDRSNWLPMLLGIAVFHGFKTAKRASRGREPDRLIEQS